MEPIAYLGLEIKQRELESRTMVAAHLLKAGIAVIFGQQWSMFANAAALPRGVMLFKTVNDIQAGVMEKCRSVGHLIAATDEEVLVCTEDECFLEVFSPTAAKNCDLFFAQSEFHRQVVERKFPSLRGKTQTAGNVRVDCLTPKRRASLGGEVKRIADTYGSYILFNTNYAQLNSIWKDRNTVANIAAKAGLLDVDDPASIKEYRAKWDWEQLNRDEMMKLLKWVTENHHGRNIVLRPHPGEVPTYWKDMFNGQERFHIIPRSNPHPWILGADLVVHTTCTTGLEAALMDKPVVNLVPGPHPTFDFVTNHINPTFRTWKEAASAIDTFFTSGDGPITEKQKHHADILSSHFSIDDKEASEKISDGLIDLLKEHGAHFSNAQDPSSGLGKFQRLNRVETMKDKFLLEPEEMASGLQKALTVLGLRINVKVKQIDDSLFMLVPTQL